MIIIIIILKTRILTKHMIGLHPFGGVRVTMLVWKVQGERMRRGHARAKRAWAKCVGDS
jgi:hypothetical protein